MGEGSRGPSGDKSRSENDIELARKAAAGDEVARETVSHIAHPLIQQKTKILCKRYCHENYLHFQCTLFPDWGARNKEAPLCDWGNQSYAWMLEDLTKATRLQAFTGENNARLTTYFYAIVHSLQFLERWKDERFGRRNRVPDYIHEISPLAGKVFLWMYNGHPVEWMAQKAGESVESIEKIADRIILELTLREKLYLLTSPKTVSLTGLGKQDDEDDAGDMEADLPDCSWDPTVTLDMERIWMAWKQLTPVEQLILKWMVIEGREADDVLAALVKAGIPIKKGVPPEKINRQQLFHFKRMTLAKLKKLAGF